MFWAVVGGVLSLIGSLVLAGVTAFLVRGRRWKWGPILAAALLPFFGFAWLAGVFFAQATINVALLGRDPGLGDGFQTPIPHGYSILMIDVPTSGEIVMGRFGLFHSRPRRVTHGVRQLQVADGFLLAAADHQTFLDYDSDFVDTFLLIEGGESELFDTVEQLREAAAARGVELALEPMVEVYAEYRITWFDFLTLFAYMAGPIGGLAILATGVAALRRLSPRVARAA